MSSEGVESPRYDVALSFAGEERSLASKLAIALKARNVSVFFDEFEQSRLWGKNLYDFLTEIYLSKAELCVMFLSEAYSRKAWTKLERQSAQARALKEDRDYILPLRVDDTPVPGVLSTLAYVDLRKASLDQVADWISEKLKGIKEDTREKNALASKDHFRSGAAKIPEGAARLKLGSFEVTFTFTTGDVIEISRVVDGQEIWLSSEGSERAFTLSNSLLQARKGHYVTVMMVNNGQPLPVLAIATMNYSTRHLVYDSGVMRYLAAASVSGASKAAKTLRSSGKPSFLKALGFAFMVILLSVMLSIKPSVGAVLFWLAFGLALVYPHIIEQGIRARSKEILTFVKDLFNVE